MAWVATTSFETTDGSTTPTAGNALSGTGDGSGWSATWSGSASYKYNTSVAGIPNGSWCVTFGTVGTGNVVRNLTTTTQTGTVRVYMQRDTNAAGTQEVILEDSGGTTQYRIRFDSAGNIVLNSSAGDVTIQAYNANQWYAIDIDFDTTVPQYRARVDGGAYTVFKAPLTGTSTTGVNKMYLDHGAVGGNNYWDFIQATPAAVTTIRDARALSLLGVG